MASLLLYRNGNTSLSHDLSNKFPAADGLFVGRNCRAIGLLAFHNRRYFLFSFKIRMLQKLLDKLHCFFGTHDWRLDAEKMPEENSSKEFPKRECRICNKAQRLFDQKTNHWIDWN